MKRALGFMNKTPLVTYNTYIGGVSATIGTAALLATKLGISVGNISNFTVVGSDIKCFITGSYVIPTSCFSGDTSITYFNDTDGLITDLNVSAFQNTPNLKKLNFSGVITLTGAYIVRYDVVTSRKIEVFLDNCTNITGQAFYDGYYHDLLIYAPKCTVLGASASVNNFVFYRVKTGSTIYLNPFLQTSNGGAEEADVAYARGLGATIRYVTNFTAPNPVTTLAAGTIASTTIQLNFTAPSSTNTIEYYEVWLNGVDSEKTVTASGQNITGLTTATNYNITVIAVDIFLNKSLISNSINATTL